MKVIFLHQFFCIQMKEGFTPGFYVLSNSIAVISVTFMPVLTIF